MRYNIECIPEIQTFETINIVFRLHLRHGSTIRKPPPPFSPLDYDETIEGLEIGDVTSFLDTTYEGVDVSVGLSRQPHSSVSSLRDNTNPERNRKGTYANQSY